MGLWYCSQMMLYQTSQSEWRAYLQVGSFQSIASWSLAEDTERLTDIHWSIVSPKCLRSTPSKAHAEIRGDSSAATQISENFTESITSVLLHPANPSASNTLSSSTYMCTWLGHKQSRIVAAKCIDCITSASVPRFGDAKSWGFLEWAKLNLDTYNKLMYSIVLYASTWRSWWEEG